MFGCAHAAKATLIREFYKPPLMDFIQKIYIGDKPLVLTDKSITYKERHPEAAGYTVFEVSGTGQDYLEQALHSLEDAGVSGVILSGLQALAAQDLLAHHYRLITAAGGLVTNREGQVLLIRRLGKWDLPKGKCEDGEDIVTCALREVEEETGIRQLTAEGEICDTWHVYEQHGQQILKQTVWFRMTTNDVTVPVPQTEESITEVRWVDRDALDVFLEDSYETIREVVRCEGRDVLDV